MSAFDALNKSALVKCGGFSTQLATHVGEQIDGDPLWGSRFDATNEEAVIQTHLDFLQNGAQIILSNTYQSSIEGFMKHLNLTKDESIHLMRKSVELTQKAKQKYLEMLKSVNGFVQPELPLIMGSIGSYGAHLHDGSEYDGSFSEHVSKEDIQNWHRPRMEACLAQGVDGLAVETIPCQMEAEALTEMIITQYPKVKFWISFQCKDDSHLAHGEDFSKAILSVWNIIKSHNAMDRLYALGLNCVNPKYVESLLKSIHCMIDDHKKIPLIVYSNSGETYDKEIEEWTGRDKCIPLESYVPKWLEMGVKIVGGCCRVYPNDIFQIRKCIDGIYNNN